jgi:hypothetical protein
MAYVNRRFTKRRSGSAELLYLLIVLAAGFSTAWWAGHKLGMDLSSVTTFASILGLTETGRVSHGAAGYQPIVETQATQPGTAPYCNAGQSAAFATTLTDLQHTVGNAIGTPLECEHPTSAIGDTIQQTSTGLVAYSKLTNTVSFTDGWRHWAMTPKGPVTWEGTDSNPPPG